MTSAKQAMEVFGGPSLVPNGFSANKDEDMPPKPKRKYERRDKPDDDTAINVTVELPNGKTLSGALLKSDPLADRLIQKLLWEGDVS